ncbi:M42 family metallopeptidase [Vagococcus coleopterorum]|uniref:M42 family metallopeptidase n=1 Tax=Vagococcus coleopterorum TaxID=2714946 RepID=A0A6G8AP28_9ENTE|nr:M42 family metallopeptidase [Vagococcus coleopterorum]QIL46747.1 M42 family metallopeptidase [Vagococcus coleopterorum]
MEQPYGNVDLELLKELSEQGAIGSCERHVSRIVKKHLEPIVDEITYDNFGSIICKKTGSESGPKIMISSHMDEVGFMVRSIDEQGFINLLPIGGWWGHVMPAQEMKVTTESGDEFIGIVGCRAPHGMSADAKSKVINPMELYLDMGVSCKGEIEELGIDVGDMITPNSDFRVMANPNYLSGKAWDDRICVGVGIDVIRQLQDKEHESQVYMVGSTQEEVGIRGARAAVHQIKPDVAIALDVTTSFDTPLDNGGGMALGNGAILSVLDGLTIANRGLLEHMEKLGMSLKLDLNYDFMTIGGTDACNIHKAMDGVVTMTLSLPTRYMHSSHLIIHRKDYWQTVELLTEFCRSLTHEQLEDIKKSFLGQ